MGNFTSIDDVLASIKTELDKPLKKESAKKVSILYACNSSGKTQLSKLFCDQYEDKVLYYNAFVEDIFNWNNDDYTLKINANAWIFKTIQEQGLERQIVDNFQGFSGSKIEPVFNIPKEQIIFNLNSSNDSNTDNIKISRGEESIFVWSVFYTILDAAIEALNDPPESRTTNDFDNIRYIIIDDPVSSMDDTRIITIALELADLIAKSIDHLKFLITTHHALFFNVLFNAKRKDWDRKFYVLSKSDMEMSLKEQNDDSPFAYHHIIISEIRDAINNDGLKRYHFNLFRALLEKTANFLGYSDGWKKLLSEEKRGKDFIKKLDHYSHNSLSDLEPKYLSENNRKEFEESFNFFLKEFKWGPVDNG